MATKREELEKMSVGFGCLGKAADDEPIFILRSQDRFAPMIVRLWADLVRITCVSASRGTPMKKLEEACNLADQMQDWGNQNGTKIPD